ncbi:hypothetical protein DAPPUDRAFT_246547 [Daphnia pulex]|uniref:Uncharacterized protein n=1 Tax=Daphnia pulex TaxID=6669 RepID=E9GQU0_DAPPU|nr:hypothetical protein DAPPUDRAFT_246547 [Daphnia pulex]|eukprot:EFX78272.1 hypothetical protein DAPPUDRAFT_246547 [Daphnia pulex]
MEALNRRMSPAIISGRLGVLVKASLRKRCSGAPRDQGSNPLMSIVGWLYTRSGATVASSDPRAGEGTREGGWGTFSSSAQKANEMWNNGKLALV